MSNTHEQRTPRMNPDRSRGERDLRNPREQHRHLRCMRRREGRALAPGDRGRPLDLQRVRHRGRRRIVDHQDADPERDRHLEAAPSPHRHISGLNQQRRPTSEPTDLEHPIGQQVGDPQRHLDRSNAQSHDGSRARDGTARDTEQGAFPATRYAPRGKSPAKPPTGSIRRGRISLRKPSRSATRPPPTSSASDEIATDGWAETSPPKPDPAGNQEREHDQRSTRKC